MGRQKNRWIVRLAAAVCIAVQALVIVPHHHHGGEAPCFNIAHCTAHTQEQSAGHGGCCRDHDHCTPEQQSAPATAHECSAKIDAAQVVSEHSCRQIIGEISIVNDCFAPELIIAPEQVFSLHSFSLTRWRQQPFPVDRYALFAAEALSVRAPSSSCLV